MHSKFVVVDPLYCADEGNRIRCDRPSVGGWGKCTYHAVAGSPDVSSSPTPTTPASSGLTEGASVRCNDVAFLDENNWYDPDHLQNLQGTLTQDPRVEWAFSLRKIVDTEGNLVAHDNCESLGTLCDTVLAWDDFLGRHVVLPVENQAGPSGGHAVDAQGPGCRRSSDSIL